MNASHCLAAGCLLAVLCGPALAAPSCRAVSGDTTRPLVELYTSEGCDSCPPADRWLSATFAEPRQAAIALAFHVDYWDRLGWKDRFADARHAERQHAAATANGVTFVYTPQLLVQGRDARWQDPRTARALSDAARAVPRASIALDVQPVAAGVHVVATARVDDARLRAGAKIGIAYVDSGLVTDVEAGENRGVRLLHDHVVRAFTTSAARAGDGTLQADVTLAAPRERGRGAEVVAFVQRAATGEVLQALSTPLTDCLPP